ncbi:glycoside hydrolase family 20 protein [Flavitalea flava]
MMQIKRMFFLAGWVFLAARPSFCSAGNLPIPVRPAIHILPEPVSITKRNGVFHFSKNTRIVLLTGNKLAEKKEAIRVVKDFVKRLKLPFPETDAIPDSSANAVILSLDQDPEIKSEEGYTIDIRIKQVRINAPGAVGLFYALESFQQLMPQGIANMIQASLPCARIVDYPRYSYRGMHLDVSRHFFSVAFIKKYLDILASFKINTFHWHLTDSHGWRLEIKQYPRLTSVGAWRADRENIPMTIAEPTGKGEPATYGGFYTQQEVKAIIAYARDRFITIIPEIEMPGHCTAALVAYPQFSDLNNKSPLLIPCGYPGDLEHNFCAGYDSTFVFLQNILSEVITLFPSPMIHIGGDEVRDGPWLNCSRCRKRMQEKGFTTGKQLQAWFTRQIDSFITTKGRRMLGWDEISHAQLSPGSVIMSWHGDTGAREGAAKGQDVIMTPYHYVYFDFYQSDPRLEPDITYAPLFLDTIYSFDPTPKDLPQTPGNSILGAEGCLWTENVPTPARVEYMLLPRLLALAEVLWTPPEKKDYPKFITRVEEQFSRFDAQGIRYATSLYNTGIIPEFDSVARNIRVTVTQQAPGYPVRYTTDGSLPDLKSPLYTQPILLNKSTVLQTALFRKGRRMGKINKEIVALHKAAGAPVRIWPEPEGEATASASIIVKRLVDGIFGTVEPYDGRWVSFHDSLVSLTLDLGKLRDIHSIGVGCMEDQVGDSYLPRSLEFSCSADGQKFEKVFDVYNKKLPVELLRHIVQYKRTKLQRKARYIRILVRNGQLNADPLKNQLFLDEIVVE